jgi:hypothetical protein
MSYIRTTQYWLEIMVEGDMQDFLGINIVQKEDGTIHLTQPHLIDDIGRDLQLDDPQAETKATPSKSSLTLKRHADLEDFDGAFDYQSIVRKLNYLERGTRANISYITHQCVRLL